MSGILGALFGLFVDLGATLPGRIFATLGIGWLTYTGISTALNTVIASAFSAWGSLPSAVYQIASLGGLTDSIGIITAAMTARIAVSAIPRLGKMS